MTPRVSILLPVFDAGPTLGICLRSLARQSLADWECVAVDDGSRDGSATLLAEAAARDARIRVLAGPHRGLVAALNSGLAACRGAYVARMDADDAMHRARLAEQVALLDRRPDLAAAGCHVRFFPRTALTEGSREYERWLNGIGDERQVATEAFVECPVAHPALMARREVLTRFAYSDRDWPEDYDLLLRLLAAGLQVGTVPRRLLCWRRHASQISRTDPRYGLDGFTRCKAAFLASWFLAGSERYVLWGHGATGRALKRELAALGKRPSHIVEVHPRRVGQSIDGVTVVPVTALPDLPRLPLVASVAGAAARGLIRAELARLGRIEGRDYVCAA